MVSVRTRLGRGVAWLTAARMLVNAMQALSMLVLTHLLLPGDLGVVVIALTMLSLLISLTDVQLSSALVQHRAPDETHYDTAWTFGLGRGVLVAVLFALAAYPTAWIYHDDRLAGLMIALGLGAIVGGLENPRTIMLTKQLVFWQQFVLQVAGKATSVVVSVGVAFIWRSYWALVVGGLAGSIVTLAVSYLLLPYRPRPTLVRGRELFSFSIWLTLGQFVTRLNWSSDPLLIGAVLGSALLGTYAVGSMVAMIVTREVTAPLAGLLFPAFSTMNDDRPRLIAAYQAAQGFLVAIALPAGVGTAILADSLVRVAMGDQWAGAVPVIRILAPVFALQTLGFMAQPAAMALGATRLLFLRDLQGFAMRVPLVLSGVMLFGLQGAVCARVVSGLLLILLDMSVVTRTLGLTIGMQLSRVWRSVLSAAAMAAVLLLIDRLIGPVHGIAGDIARMVLLGIVGMLSYAIIHFLAWHWSHRPPGPEDEAVRVWNKVSQRWMRRRVHGQ